MTNNSSTSIDRPLRVGVFDTVAAADRAIVALEQAGFTEEELTVFRPDSTEQDEDSALQPDAETGVPVKHLLSSSLLGGTVGGIASATLVTAAGAPIVAVGGLAGLLTGGVVGGLAGAMMNRGVEKEDADFFDQAVAEGKTLVSVEPLEQSSEKLEVASRVLEEAGAQPLPLREG